MGLRRLAAPALTVAAAAALAAVARAGPPEVRLLRCERARGAVEVGAEVGLRAPRSCVWQVLTDYDHVADFVPGVEFSRRLPATGAAPLVEQVGAARMLWMTGRARVLYRAVEQPPGRLAFTAAGGDFLEFDGAWQADSLAPDSTRLCYEARIRPRGFTPHFILIMGLEREIPRRVGAIGAEAERRHAAGCKRMGAEASGP